MIKETDFFFLEASSTFLVVGSSGSGKYYFIFTEHPFISGKTSTMVEICSNWSKFFPNRSLESVNLFWDVWQQSAYSTILDSVTNPEKNITSQSIPEDIQFVSPSSDTSDIAVIIDDLVHSLAIKHIASTVLRLFNTLSHHTKLCVFLLVQISFFFQDTKILFFYFLRFVSNT